MAPMLLLGGLLGRAEGAKAFGFVPDSLFLAAWSVSGSSDTWLGLGRVTFPARGWVGGGWAMSPLVLRSQRSFWQVLPWAP